MKIKSLKFSTDHSEASPLQSYLNIESAQDLEKLKDDILPVIYLIQEQDLSRVRELKDSIIDRGIKDKRIELYRSLVGKEEDRSIVIDGNYNAAGRLLTGIRKFFKALPLNESKEKGTRNLFIIGAKKDIFESLWKGADGGKEGGVKQSTRSNKSLPDLDGADENARQLLDELGNCKVPPELERRYVGSSLKVKLVRKLITLVAQKDIPVLILGDTGTGKEVVARAIHDFRHDRKPFRTINCGAIPHELFESELFGYKKGAFTGALEDKEGSWEEAKDGTLFLDEIGDLPLYQQVKILRALGERRIKRVGETSYRPVQARVIAATNRDLSSMVKNGQFREDLYYRLRGFLIRTPALRDHAEDIPELAQFFWKKITEGNTRELPWEVIEKLKMYSWPGNARELKMVLSSLNTLFPSVNLGIKHLKLVFYNAGISWINGDEPAAERRNNIHLAECHRHLKRVDDAIRAARFSLRPLIDDRITNEKTMESVLTSLIYRLNELEMLCRQPLLFHSESLFSAVWQLKGKLSYFQSLLQEDVKEVLKYWEEILAKDFNLVTSAVTKEVESVLPNGK